MRRSHHPQDKRLRQLRRLSYEYSQVFPLRKDWRQRRRELRCLLALVRKPGRTRLGYLLSQKWEELPCRWPECRARWPNLCRAEERVSSIGFLRTLRSLTLLWLRLWLRVSPVATGRLEKAFQALEDAREVFACSIAQKSSQRPLASRLIDPLGIWQKAKTWPLECRPLDLSMHQETNESPIPLLLSSEELPSSGTGQGEVGAETPPGRLSEGELRTLNWLGEESRDTPN